MVIHCFTGSQRLSEACLMLGAYISLSGIVTFKNAKALQDVARTIPAGRLLVETDSPFLAPVPMRGKVCEPAYVAHTARFLAELRDEPLESLVQRTYDNTRTLFTKMQA
jgi:TatD DNase family protein